jgi:hypothetical protein
MTTKTTKGIKLKTDKTGKVRVVPKMTGKTLNQQYASRNRKRYRGVK